MWVGRLDYVGCVWVVLSHQPSLEGVECPPLLSSTTLLSSYWLFRPTLLSQLLLPTHPDHLAETHRLLPRWKWVLEQLPPNTTQPADLFNTALRGLFGQLSVVFRAIFGKITKSHVFMCVGDASKWCLWSLLRYFLPIVNLSEVLFGRIEIVLLILEREVTLGHSITNLIIKLLIKNSHHFKLRYDLIFLTEVPDDFW